MSSVIKIRYIKEHTPGIENAIIVHRHDDLGLANANTLAAIKAGARQVEGTINGLGERAGNVAIEEVVMALKTRHDYFGDLQVNIDTKQFTKVSKLVSRLTGCRSSTKKNQSLVPTPLLMSLVFTNMV